MDVGGDVFYFVFVEDVVLGCYDCVVIVEDGGFDVLWVIVLVLFVVG